MWLMVSSLSPHSLHLLCCCVLSILVLIWLVLTPSFCDAIRRDSFPLLKFPFLGQVQVFWSEIFIIIVILLRVVFSLESPQVFRTLLITSADLSNSIVWMVSTRHLISKYSSPSTNPFGDCTKSTYYIWYHRHIHVPPVFFNSLTRSKYLSFFSFSFSFTVVIRVSKGYNLANSLFIFCWLLLGLVVCRRLDVPFVFQNPWKVFVSFFRTGAWLCLSHLFVWSNLKFLHIPQWIILPTHSYLVLYSSCAYLLYLLIMLLIVSSLSPHNLYLLFCCILSILTFI